MSDNEYNNNHSDDDGYDNLEKAIDKKFDQQEQFDRPQSQQQNNRRSSNNNNYNDYDQQNQQYNDQDEQEEEEEEKISDSLERLSQVIKMNHITLENFWKSDQIQVPIDIFEQFMYQINLNPDENELEELRQDLADEDGRVYLKIVCDKIKPWRAQENAMLEFIQQRALNIAQNSKKRANQQFKISKQEKNRPKTANYSAGRPVSAITHKSYRTKASNAEDIRDIPIETRPPVPDKSKMYLKKYKERQREQDRLLKLTINKGKNEYEYEMLINMGDANELSQKLNSKITYRAYKGAQGNLKVHVYELDKYLKELTLEEFQREYNIIKSKYNETQNKNIWEHLSETKKNQGQKTFSKGAGIEDEGDEHEQSKKGFNKKQRVQELKKVLLDTMVLTNVLKEQLAVLNKKGINQSANQQQNKNNYTMEKSQIGGITQQQQQSNYH